MSVNGIVFKLSEKHFTIGQEKCKIRRCKSVNKKIKWGETIVETANWSSWIGGYGTQPGFEYRKQRVQRICL